MVQFQLSSALDKGRQHDHKVVCIQRTTLGLFVGTLQETADGYTGHLLSPKHPLLPDPRDSCLGFLASNRDAAYEALALHVAKAAYETQPSFEATCLNNCSRATQDAFVVWLVTKVLEPSGPPANRKFAPQTASAPRTLVHNTPGRTQ